MNVAHVQLIFWIFFDTYEYSVFMYPYFSTKQIRVLSRLRVGVPIRTDILPAYIYAFEYKHDFFSRFIYDTSYEKMFPHILEKI